MSHGLVPSKSTVYISNLPFSLTNNDLYKIFEKCGKIVKITIVKDRKTKESKGVAFILFLSEEEAKTCVSLFHSKQIGGRTIRASIAIDNGRSKEFIRKRIYDDKSKCYECGESGHLSYCCPRNTLGVRKPPPKKKKKRKTSEKNEIRNYESSDEDYYYNEKAESDRYVSDKNADEESDVETLSAAIRLEQQKRLSDSKTDVNNSSLQSKKRIHKSAYFSDEEEVSE